MYWDPEDEIEDEDFEELTAKTDAEEEFEAECDRADELHDQHNDGDLEDDDSLDPNDSRNI